MHLSSQGIENGGITITSDGNVGIGNAVVVAGTLEVDEDISTTNSEIICNAGGNTDKGFKLTSNNGAFICGYLRESNNAGVLRVQGGVNQFNSSVFVQLDGRFGEVSGSTFTTFSDDRIKSYERPVTDALGTLALCQPKKYRKHIGHIIDGDDETPDLNGVQWVEEYGLVAQELEAVGLNHFVRNNPDDPNGIKSVSYIELVPVLIQAVKELTARLRALE